MTPLADEIKKLRKQRKLTQTQLAKLSGLNQKDISNFENGHTDVRLSTLQQIAQALDLKLMLIPKLKLEEVSQSINKTNFIITQEALEKFKNSFLERFRVSDDED